MSDFLENVFRTASIISIFHQIKHIVNTDHARNCIYNSTDYLYFSSNKTLDE